MQDEGVESRAARRSRGPSSGEGPAPHRHGEIERRLAVRMLRAVSVDENLRIACEETACALGMDLVTVYLFDGLSKTTSPAYSHGAIPGLEPRPITRASIEDHVASYGSVSYFDDIARHPELPNRTLMLDLGVRSIATAALHTWVPASPTGSRPPRVGLVGAIACASFGHERRLDDDDIGFLESVADLLSVRLARVGEAARDREILSIMTEGVMISDPSARILFVNEACERMLGYEPGELVGRKADALLFPEDVQATAQRRAELESTRRPFRRLNRYRTKSGGELWASAAGIAIEDGGSFRGYLGVLTDVTESRKLETKIQHAQKLESLGVLAGGIAHDFNNLLVGILGNAGLALDELQPESPARDQIADIQVAAVRAGELTKQLLAYAGKGRFVVTRLDLQRVVEEMGHLLGAVLPKNVVLKYDFGRGLRLVEGDATQLRQVVMNLITNAGDAIGHQSGVITVTTRMVDADRAYLAETYIDEALPPGTYVGLEVCDTGCGMSAETRAKIFDPFFTTKFTGRGLGLAAVLGILRSHRAAIKVYSEPGRGTTFKVLFPAVEGGDDARARASTRPEDWRGTGLLLVIDDEEAVRTVVRRTFERAGFDVLVAADGVEGVEAFLAHKSEIRAVLLDVTMPRMGGEETFRRLRQIEPNVRVLLSSGYSEQEATSRFAGKGLAGFVEKPFRMQELLEQLRAVLET